MNNSNLHSISSFYKSKLSNVENEIREIENKIFLLDQERKNLLVAQEYFRTTLEGLKNNVQTTLID